MKSFFKTLFSNVLFWAIVSAALNVIFLLDFLVTAFTGSSIAMNVFGRADSSLVAAVTSHVEGMTATEFFIANGFVLAILSVMIFVMVYVAFWESNRKKLPGFEKDSFETAYTTPSKRTIGGYRK